MIESQLKQVFIGNLDFKLQLESFLDIKDISVVPEVQFINGISADFCLFDNNNSIISIIECKGADIGVTEYVRGIGQILQYQHFKEQNIGYNISKKCKIFLSFPNTMMHDNSFDITKFSYPDESELLIVNSQNYSPIIINPNVEYKKIKKELNTIQISPYYFRDIRISAMYIILLEILKHYKVRKYPTISRTDVGQILLKYNTTNKNNARNVFISLSSLGLIDVNNFPTIKGVEFSKLDFANFASNIAFEYYKPFINEIFRAFDTLQCKTDKYHIQSTTNDEISTIIKNFHAKDVYYLTESKNRYISSWLNSLRDDLGCIDFLPNKFNKEIKIKYNPLYSEMHTIQQIRQQKILFLENYLNNY